FRRSTRLRCSFSLVDPEACAADPLYVLFATKDNLCAVLERPGRRILELRDAATGRLTKRLFPPADFHFDVAVSADSKLVAWACNNGLVRINSVPANDRIRTLTSDTGCGGGMAFSSDGKMIAVQASGLENVGSYLLWDLATGRVVKRLSGESNDS